MSLIAAGVPQVKADARLVPDADAMRRLEDDATERVYAALQKWGRSLFRDVTADSVALLVTRLDDAEFNKPMRDALIAVLQDVAEAGADFGRQQIETVVYGTVKRTAQIDPGAVDWTQANNDAAQWATEYGYQLIRGITDTTRARVATEVRYFVDNSITINELRDRLMSGSLFNRQRAGLIAATEVTRAYASGAMRAWEKSGVVEGKEWVTANDEIAAKCPICGPLHGKIVPLNEMFNGRISGPPAHPNCILPGNEVVVPGPLSAATKSFYNGKAIEILVRSGRVLTVTENHPILTPVGYRTAKALRKGDYVISATNPNRIASAIDPNNDHVPAAIEEVFRSLKESPAMFTATMPATAEDFHGDGRAIYGDIEIVYIDRLLQGDGISPFSEHISQQVFSSNGVASGSFFAGGTPDQFAMRKRAAAGRVMGGPNLLPPLGVRHRSPFDTLGFGLVARGDTGLNQPVADNVATGIQAIGNGFFRFTGPVTGSNRGRIQTDTLAGSVFVDAGIPENSGNDLVRHALLGRQFIDRFAGLVAPDEIVSIREFDFSGHVYDLQCDRYELYITSGIVTSNCRCAVVPVVIGDTEVFANPFGL